jgi:hypothetical protein
VRKKWHIVFGGCENVEVGTVIILKIFVWYFLGNATLKNLLIVSGHTGMPKNVDQGVHVSFLLRGP